MDMSDLKAPLPDTGAFFARDTGSITFLNGQPCANCTGNLFMVQDGGFFVSDGTVTKPGGLSVWDFSSQTKLDPLEIPAGRQPVGMLTMDDPWLVSVQSVCV